LPGELKRAWNFGGVSSTWELTENLPSLDEIRAACGLNKDCGMLIVCDENTKKFADAMPGSPVICALDSGEEHKTKDSVEHILSRAADADFDRSSLFIGVGGGVVCDLTGFAASIYMRGVRLALIPTTLLCMADASLGGKTGFDLFGLKNLAGTFYPASRIWAPLKTLESLPERERKSGFAEIVKALIIKGKESVLENTFIKDFSKDFYKTLYKMPEFKQLLFDAVSIKGNIVEQDPRESAPPLSPPQAGGTEGGRMQLNLGHTFAHALESCAGLGSVPHGEAVAWGCARACVLGEKLGVTPPERAARITALLDRLGYETRWPHSALAERARCEYIDCIKSDKKKSGETIRFIVPNADSVELAAVSEKELGTLLLE
jgi:3-dehydroquinate synthase